MGVLSLGELRGPGMDLRSGGPFGPPGMVRACMDPGGFVHHAEGGRTRPPLPAARSGVAFPERGALPSRRWRTAVPFNENNLDVLPRSALSRGLCSKYLRFPSLTNMYGVSNIRSFYLRCSFLFISPTSIRVWAELFYTRASFWI